MIDFRLTPDDWSEVLSLLDAALERSDAETEGWAAGLDCAPRLKHVVGRLLRHRRAIDSGGFLNRMPAVLKAEPISDPLLSEGAQVGAYRLLRRLGEGGMGTVWLAERCDAQRPRRVALKFPHAGPGQQVLAQRLLRERDILASLAHPNIARLYDVGLAPDGTPFLVLEHVDGLPLCEWCNEHRCTIAQRLALFQQVLRAVQYAHHQRVLHRDLKPSNILVDAAGQVRLLDFGVATLLGDVDGASARHAIPALTPDYAAPEQIAGKTLGTACDVYALGVVLFELLTGQRPYRLSGTTAAQLQAAILAAAPRRLSDVWRGPADATRFATSRAAVRRALRGEVDVIVMKALRKAPGERHASAEAMAQEIARHLAPRPGVTRSVRDTRRPCCFMHRKAPAMATGPRRRRWSAGRRRAVQQVQEPLRRRAQRPAAPHDRTVRLQLGGQANGQHAHDAFFRITRGQ